MTTTTKHLTTQQLTHWVVWYTNTLSPQLTPFNELQETGTFWVYYSCHKPSFYHLSPYSYAFKQETISKVSKLKVGGRYRKDIEGWIVPDELVEEFKECIEVSRLYKELVKDAIGVISKADWNGYSRVKNLSPEKMQQLIDVFAE